MMNDNLLVTQSYLNDLGCLLDAFSFYWFALMMLGVNFCYYCGYECCTTIVTISAVRYIFPLGFLEVIAGHSPWTNTGQ